MAEYVKKQDNHSRARPRPRYFSAATAEVLMTIILFILAGVSFLALLGLGGPFGGFFDESLNTLLGWGKWLAPVYFLIWAGVRLQKNDRRGIILIGLTFFV